MNTKDDERRHRILIAAADLIGHYGYNKTTVADIAAKAGISKGAIYLHFKSKEEVFEALLIDSMFKFSASWFDAVEADPDGGRISRMYLNMLHALDDNPFMSVIMRKDPSILGNYLKQPNNFFEKQQSSGMREEFIVLMQKAGSVREDLDPAVTAHIMDIFSYGLIFIADYKNANDIPSTDKVIQGIADMMEKALTPPGGGSSNAGKRILRQLYSSGINDFKNSMNEK
ncbi:TetR/AcrR family transcriptional regulator [Maritalea sp.]|uniref:TetR/AcrR family transcriptional regulator n=1 Tax=Maritalea sp. TaxID=2003361 RepID=UPI0039E382A2